MMLSHVYTAKILWGFELVISNMHTKTIFHSKFLFGHVEDLQFRDEALLDRALSDYILNSEEKKKTKTLKVFNVLEKMLAFQISYINRRV